MKNKSTIIMGAVFLILVVVYFLTSYNPSEITQGATPLFEGPAPDIDSIEITQPVGLHVVLKRREGTWYLEEPFQFKADDRYVNMLVGEIQNVMIDGVISDKEETRVQYSVTDSGSVALKVMEGDTVLFDGFIGRRSQEIGHSYARRRGSDDIELWRGMISQEVRRDPNEWRDRVIYSINRDDIIKIEMVEGDSRRILTFADTAWKYEENGTQKPVDNMKIRQAAAMIAELSCDDFANEDDMNNIIGRDPEITVTFTVRNGDTETYDLWRPIGNNTRFLMRREEGDIIYRFYGNRGVQLALEYDTFKPPES